MDSLPRKIWKPSSWITTTPESNRTIRSIFSVASSSPMISSNRIPSPKTFKYVNFQLNHRKSFNSIYCRCKQLKIRMKGSPRVLNTDRSPWSPVETWMTDFQFPIFQLPGPRFKNRTAGGNPGPFYHQFFFFIFFLCNDIDWSNSVIRFSSDLNECV